jgi:hypothetical protein
MLTRAASEGGGCEFESRRLIALAGKQRSKQMNCSSKILHESFGQGRAGRLGECVVVQWSLRSWH